MSKNENIWATALVMKEKDEESIERTVVYSSSFVASSYEEALGIALSQYKIDLEKGQKILVTFDACEQDDTDLGEMMRRKGWKHSK